jgi:hypothetical protein
MEFSVHTQPPRGLLRATSYLFLRRKDFLNSDLDNEVLTTQVNQTRSLLVVR